MGKRYNNLFDKIVDTKNFWDAYRKTARGKRNTRGYLEFRYNEASNMKNLIELVKSGEYTRSPGRRFTIYEPKPREIEANPFADRIVQHAVNNILTPIFDEVFLPQSYACRSKKGAHRAAIHVQSMLRKFPNAYVLKTDFSKYFKSVDLKILYREIKRKIKCKRTLGLLKRIIRDTGSGLPIGSLTSQLYANIYGHIVDRWLVHQKSIRTFTRYMDDIVIFGDDWSSMKKLQEELGGFIQKFMKLKFSKWFIRPANRGVNFCGYRIWENFKLIRKSSIRDARMKIRKYINKGYPDKLQKFIASWIGHIQWADSYNLIKRFGITEYANGR